MNAARQAIGEIVELPATPPVMPKCIDCLYHLPPKGATGHRCSHPACANPVDGRPERCEDARTSHLMCAYEARLFDAATGNKAYLPASVARCELRGSPAAHLYLRVDIDGGSRVRVKLPQAAAEWMLESLLDCMLPHRIAKMERESTEASERHRNAAAYQSPTSSGSPSLAGLPQDGQSVDPPAKSSSAC